MNVWQQHMQHVPDGNHGGDQVDETDGIVLADWERNIGPSSARGFYYESLDFEVDNPRNISELKKKRFRNQVKAMTQQVCYGCNFILVIVFV